MSIQVNDFQWEPGKNDAEYIKLLESSRDEWQKIAQKAITRLKTLSKAKEVKPHRNYQYLSDYWCDCGWHLGRAGSVKFCPECGRKVKWE